MVAETLEQAAYAARLVGVTYTPETPATDVTHVELRLPTQEKTVSGDKKAARDEVWAIQTGALNPRQSRSTTPM